MLPGFRRHASPSTLRALHRRTSGLHPYLAPERPVPWIFCRYAPMRCELLLTTPTVQAFAPTNRDYYALCGLLRRAQRISRLPQSPFGDRSQISRGKTGRLHRAPAKFTTAALDGYGLRDELLTRPATTASYLVSVRRVAALLHASFRPRLATTPLRFANPSPPSGWVEDSHLQATDHARHTTPGRGAVSLCTPGISSACKSSSTFPGRALRDPSRSTAAAAVTKFPGATT